MENFPRTFYVGGMVRDLLLNRKVTDIDIATAATPDQVAEVLQKGHIKFDASLKNFAVLVARRGKFNIEIATFRTETYQGSRYPKISLVTNQKLDSKRRDFTINALYLSPKADKILDFHNGLADIKAGQIKFIGSPGLKIRQDPLRIIRALRFALSLKFKLDRKTFLAIKNDFSHLSRLTKAKTCNEILKLKDNKIRGQLKQIISAPALLDKYFKYRYN